MSKSKETVSVRVDAEDYKYLKLLAAGNLHSIAGAISTAIKQCEKAEPITFNICKFIHNNASELHYVFFSVGGNLQEHRIGKSSSLSGALGLLDTYRNENGYTDCRRFKLEKEIEVFDLRFEVDPRNGSIGLA
jgi:hypothetical protein